ncbi:MAG: hypothetical protein JSV07_08835 [Acidimicrobiia bacterium]|nr:MAG: hypothetical protein JSV07_08835 [Acidimicrobiia bacterium]
MRQRLIPFLVAAALVLANCTGGSSDTTTTTAAPATTTTSTTTTTVAPTLPPETTSTSVPASGDIDPGLAEVLDAAFANAQSGSWQAEGTWEITGDLDGSGLSATAEIGYAGAYDAETGNSFSLLDLSAMGSLGVTGGDDFPPEMAAAFSAFETRTVDGVAYLRFPLFAMMFGATTEWISLPEEDSGSATSFIPFASFGEVGTAIGSLREGLVGAEEVGKEQVNGVDATRYLLVIDASVLGDGSEGVPASGEQAIDVWIDGDGNLLRYLIDIDAPELDEATGAGAERLVIDVLFTGIGEPVVIEAPDAAEVTDVSGLFAGLTP